MPVFEIHTNVSKDAVPKNLTTELTTCVAQTLGKPEKFVCIHIIPDQLMTFNGTADPCANCVLGCIGKLSEEENKAHTKALFEKVSTALGVSPDRMYIFYKTMTRENTAWNNKTFAEI